MKIKLTLLFLLLTQLLFSQFIIKGKVIDSTKQGIPFVTIKIKGTSMGVSADANGYFSIKINTQPHILTFHALNYLEKEINLPLKDSFVLITLKRNPNAVLYEVVITSANVSKNRIKGKSSLLQKRIIAKTLNEETKFTNVSCEPISTFGVDVDKASYSYVRKSLNENKKPLVDIIRAEEMINYFTYNYPNPTIEYPYSLISELTDCPWNIKNKLLKIGLKGKNELQNQKKDANFIFLIDVSGSMQGEDRIELVKKSLTLLLDSLSDNDLISVVTYAGKSGVLLEAVPVSNRKHIIEKIENLGVGGSTAGSLCIKTAYEIANKHFIEDGNNRIILCTDGDFNVGATSYTALERLIEEEKLSGIYLTCLGFGNNNYKDAIMEVLADKGNGNYYYIDNINEAKRVLQRDFRGTINTIAKDVKLQLDFNSSFVKAYRLIGYENRLLDKKDFDNDKKDAGEIGEGHTITVLYEIVPAGLSFFDNIDTTFCPNVNSNSESNILATIKTRYKLPNSNKSKKLDYMIVNNPVSFENCSNDTKWATFVSMFSMELKHSIFKGTTNSKLILDLIKRNIKAPNDEQKEMIELIKIYDTIKEK